MPPKKAPLAERDANTAPRKSSSKQKPSDDPAPQVSSDKTPSLLDVANKIATTHGKKRDHDDVDTENNSNDLDLDFDSPQTFSIKWDADQIRRKINTIINNGEMKVGEFQDLLRVSPRSYGSFMGQSGPNKGTGSDTFSNAHIYFTKREEQGKPLPRAKKAKTSASSSKKDDEDKFDVSDITLEKEEDQAVPIYDTCDDLRTKIRAHLRVPSQTQAGLARAMAQTYQVAGDNNHKIQGAQITRFLGKKGPKAGATSSVYYAGYVYFEKLRVKQKKPKSKKRQEMEREYPNGAPTDTDGSGGLWLGPNETASEDKYGKLHITQLPPGATDRLPRRRRGW